MSIPPSPLLPYRWEYCLSLVFPKPGGGRKAASVMLGDIPVANTQDDFFSSVSESVAKLLLHLAWLTETGVRQGRGDR